MDAGAAHGSKACLDMSPKRDELFVQSYKAFLVSVADSHAQFFWDFAQWLEKCEPLFKYAVKGKKTFFFFLAGREKE